LWAGPVEPGANGVEECFVHDTAELSALLCDYLEQLDHRLAAVDDLRREATALGPEESAEVLPVLDAVGDTVRRSDERTRVLLRWLQAGPN
jgi:hypothetical protein